MATIPSPALAAVPIFADLAPDALRLLEAASRIRCYPRGQVLCSEGDPGEELVLLEAGHVKVSRFSRSGQETVLDEVGAPTAFGELALFDGAPRSASVTAMSDVKVRYLARRKVVGLVERDPAVAIAMMQNMAAKVRATNERLSDLLTLDAPGRLAKWLLTHADRDGQLTLELSQESLAHSLGTTRETINRTLRRFERLGLIEVRGKRISLRDMTALKAIAFA